MTQYNVFSAHKDYSADKMVGSSKWHKRLVKEQAVKLVKYGTCYCFNHDQATDIMSTTRLNAKIIERDEILYLEVIK